MTHFVITTETTPDQRGRQRFVMEWDLTEPDAHGRMKRAQYFFARTSDHVKLHAADGHTTEVIDTCHK